MQCNTWWSYTMWNTIYLSNETIAVSENVAYNAMAILLCGLLLGHSNKIIKLRQNAALILHHMLCWMVCILAMRQSH